jgi:hypothetical protein
MTPEQFKAEFSSRTLAFVPGFSDPRRPLIVSLGTDAHSPAGHALLISLANQLARVHGQLLFVGDLDVPLLCHDPFGHRTLAEATAGLARAINPFITADVARVVPETDRLMVIGIGDVPGADLRVGYRGWLAFVGGDVPIVETPSSMWGALFASCIAASAAFHAALGTPGRPEGALSSWEYGRLGGADGPSSAALELGRVLQVGAGAVGCALDLFLPLVQPGVGDGWLIADGDVVDVSNLNRHLLFLAADAGYPEGAALAKADVATHRFSPAAAASPHWYGDDPIVQSGVYDIVLPLANERGVRAAIQARQPTVLLHATTSNNWQAQLHRHVAGVDDCITCRIPPGTPRLRCSTSTVETAGREVDATLPFLSAAAGLMLAVALARLSAGALVEPPFNFAALDLGASQPRFQELVHSCKVGCRSRLDRAKRMAMDGGSRWVHLDAGS